MAYTAQQLIHSKFLRWERYKNRDGQTKEGFPEVLRNGLFDVSKGAGRPESTISSMFTHTTATATDERHHHSFTKCRSWATDQLIDRNSNCYLWNIYTYKGLCMQSLQQPPEDKHFCLSLAGNRWKEVKGLRKGHTVGGAMIWTQIYLQNTV